jgi:hypothetical protein
VPVLVAPVIQFAVWIRKWHQKSNINEKCQQKVQQLKRYIARRAGEQKRLWQNLRIGHVFHSKSFFWQMSVLDASSSRMHVVKQNPHRTSLTHDSQPALAVQLALMHVP